MEEDKITIICPQCRKKTRIPNIGAPGRNVKCASCQFKGSLMLFQIDIPKPKSAASVANTSSRSTPTVIESVNNYQINSSMSNNGATIIDQNSNNGGGNMANLNGGTIIDSQQPVAAVPSMGYLQVSSINQKYTLKQGSNIIGRQHPTSQATIQIATNDGYMSRQHMRIDVLLVGNQLEYRVSDNNSTNKLAVNGKQLNSGDIVMLRPGDRITIGHTDILFMI